MMNRIRKISKEWLVLEIYTLVITWILYFPLGFILGFNLTQWKLWFGIGTIYDIVMAYPISKLVIMFNAFARKRKWY